MRTAYVTAILMLVFACQNKSVKNTESLSGKWESVGSGWVLEIKDSTSYQFYDITSISCLPNRKGSFKELQKSLTLENDTLNLLKGVITYKFTRSKALPQLCIETKTEKNKNPIYNFEVFAETVKEHYAFFKLNKINWNQLYKQQKGKLTEKSTDVELYQVIEETLESLKDNHAFLEASEEVNTELEKQSNQDKNSSENLPEYGDIQVAGIVAKHHLQVDLTRDYKLQFPLIQWGKLNNVTGYIQVKTMWLFADLDVPKKRIDEVGYVDAFVETFHQMYEGDYIKEEVKEVSKIMDMVMNDLSEMKSIIIDVRFNGGGQDAVSFEILSRFIPKGKLQIATQKLRYGNRFTPLLPLYIDGNTNAFTKPVYVLTSKQTGSAAEAFSIATMAMKNANRIGSATSGAMSTALEKKLPNGWSFAISNEIYMDNNGKSYENIGVPVDYNLDYSNERQTFFRSVVNDLEADKQNILKAISILKEKCRVGKGESHP
jgi:carboxyl-terminal processing protease